MFLTKCAACAADCTTSIKACGRCQTVYCSAQCQKQHWESGHDRLCKMIKRKGGAEQLYADKQYKASIKLAVEKCAQDARSQALLNAAKQLGDLSFCDMEERKRFLELSAEDAGIEEDEATCFICLSTIHETTKEGVVRGCGCKGSQGHAHITCLAKQAQLKVEEGEATNAADMAARWSRWTRCAICDQNYRGVVSCALGWACWRSYVQRPMEAPAKRAALTTLGSGLMDGDRASEALTVFQAQLKHAYKEQDEESITAAKGNCAMCLSKLGRDAEAVVINRELYGQVRKANGTDDIDTLVAALTLAKSLRALSSFSEARALLREVVPIAMTTLGGDHGVTLELNSNFVRAMCMDLNATADQLRAAVDLAHSTHEAALRRYGDGHELTHLCRASLADARVVAQNAGLER